jgi:hypothetical protein
MFYFYKTTVNHPFLTLNILSQKKPTQIILVGTFFLIIIHSTATLLPSSLNFSAIKGIRNRIVQRVILIAEIKILFT